MHVYLRITYSKLNIKRLIISNIENRSHACAPTHFEYLKSILSCISIIRERTSINRMKANKNCMNQVPMISDQGEWTLISQDKIFFFKHRLF